MAKLLGCLAPLVTMPSNLAHAPAPEIRARTAEPGDIDALIDLEHRVFATDRLSRMFRTHPPLAERVRRLRALDAGEQPPAGT